MSRQPDWDDDGYMDWADQERLVRQDVKEFEDNMRQARIIRCSDGWMRSHYGIQQEAVKVAEAHVLGTNETYVII